VDPHVGAHVDDRLPGLEEPPVIVEESQIVTESVQEYGGGVRVGPEALDNQVAAADGMVT
jgi:hypothetical protein